MLRPLNAVLICVNQDNANQIAVLLNGLAKHYTDRLLVAYSNEIPQVAQDAIERGGWIVDLIEFKMDVPEAGMVVKAIQRLYDSSYQRVLYLNSNTLVQGDLSELLTVEIRDICAAAAADYDYMGDEQALKMYAAEDPSFAIRERKHKLRYFNTDVLLLNMNQIRRANLDIDGLFQAFWQYRYQIELGLCEFMNQLLSDKTVAQMPRKFNFKADRYLHNTRPYHKLIRSNKAMAEAPIANYRSAQPWDPELKLDRLTFQVPMHKYLEQTEEIAEHLPEVFVEAVRKNAQKWEARLGKLPQAIEAYHQ